MEKARPLPDTLAEIHSDTHVEGSGRRTPISKRRESGERPAEQREATQYFNVEDRASGTQDFAVRNDPESGLVVFVDGRDAPPQAAEHVANGVFTEAVRRLPEIMTKTEPVVIGALNTEIYRPRRPRGEELLAAATEHALAEGDLFRENAKLSARGDRETALEIPASAALAIIPDRITEDEIIGVDKDTAEIFADKTALTADDTAWTAHLKKFVDEELSLRKLYEASRARLAPLLNRAGRYLKGGDAAKFLEGSEDDLIASLKRGAADFLARFEKEPPADPLTEMRRQRKKEYREGKENVEKTYARIAKLPIYSAEEKAEFETHKSALNDWGTARLALEKRVLEREELAAVRGLIRELRNNLQDAGARVERMLQTDEPLLGADERMLLAEALTKDEIIRDPGLLARLREPHLTPEEKATVGALKDVLLERQESVEDVMATDAFRELSRSGRYALAARLLGKIANLERLRLLETRAVVISGRLGNDILVYRLRNGKLDPLHDAMMRRGQETFELRGLDRPIRANQTARESFSAEFGDQFVILPAEHAQLRADVTLAAAKDPEDMLRRMSGQEHYPMVKITVRPPKKAAASPAIDTEAQAS